MSTSATHCSHLMFNFLKLQCFFRLFGFGWYTVLFSGHCLVTVKTQFLGSFGRQTDAPDGLNFPIGVNVCADGKLLACDTRSNVVKLFNRDGRVAGVIDRAVGRHVTHVTT